MQADMSRTLHVVVSCKSRKTMPVPAQLCASTLQGKTLAERLHEWTSTVDSSEASLCPAAQLYAGDHWKVVLKMQLAANEEDAVRLWVASAGYGLVPIDSPLKPYSATFVPRHSESVAPTGCGHTSADWWNGLANWHHTGTVPRTITELAEHAREAKSFVLLALSEPYVQAMAPDILAASSIAREHVALVSVGLGNDAAGIGLDDVALPVQAKLKRLVGGAMQGVNARIAQRIVSHHHEWFPHKDRLRELIEIWVGSVAPLPKYARTPMSDDEVLSFIRAHLAGDGPSSRSRLLRTLRDSGKACEQHRFGRLYAAYIAQSNAVGDEALTRGST